MRCVRAIAFLVGMVVCAEDAMSQSDTVPKPEDLVKIPASPEVKAFDKYGNIPANPYTGTVDISIPIATLEGRSINLPINLRYDASGIKVDQIATWVGLGWNLDVGGAVTRQAVGLPDDYDPNHSNPDYAPFYSEADDVASDVEFVTGFPATLNTRYDSGDVRRYVHFMRNVLEGTPNQRIEYQPDVYSFNALGISGNLLINYETDSAWCTDHPEYKAVVLFNEIGAMPIKAIRGWIITDAKGNKYYFEHPEVTHVWESPSDEFREYNSSWLLTKIESTNHRDEVIFNYSTSVMWEQEQLAGRAMTRVENMASGDFGIANADYIDDRVKSTYKISQSSLMSIEVNGRTLAEFNESETERLDLLGRKSLESIVINNINEERMKKFDLVQSYFGEPGETDEKEVRLRLDRLEAHGTDDLTNPPTHIFQYNGSVLPSRESFSQDFWGYYNGVANESLIPYDYDLDVENFAIYGFKGADRNPRLESAKTGSIDKIIYPTGGSTEFHYDSHKSEETAYTYEEEVTVKSASCKGGASTELKCEPDDAYNPKIVSTFYHTATSGVYKITFRSTGSSNSNTSMHRRFVAVYKETDANDEDVEWTPCYIANNSVDILADTNYLVPYLKTNVSPNYTESVVVTLPPSGYRIVIINSDPLVTMGVEVSQIVTRYVNDAGGIRIKKLVDKNEAGEVASKRYLFYGDLSLVHPDSVTEAYLDASHRTSGTLHDSPQFQDVRSIGAYDTQNTPTPLEYDYYRVSRFCENRTRSNYHVTYPVVSEVQFSNTAAGFNGFVVNEYENTTESYVNGYRKNAILNGRQKIKRIYNSDLQLQRLEKTSYSLETLGTKESFFFSSTRSDAEGLFIMGDSTSGHKEEYYTYAAPEWFKNPISHEWVMDACGRLRESDDPDEYYIECFSIGSKNNKTAYNYYRFWPKTDSVRTVDYFDGDSIVNVSKSFYENPKHFQVTSTETTDSKGVLKKKRIFYAHEMVTELPRPAWPAMVTANRIAEPVMIEATFADNQPDFKQVTLYRSISTSSGAMIVPDTMQFSTGSNALENRIRHYNYDDMGNASEVGRSGDVRLSYLYGYNKQYPIAQVTGASVNEIFFTSFENGEEGGNSSDNDSKSGSKSKTGGYSKSLTGLTSGKSYVLTYWKKSSGTWSLYTVAVPSLGSTSYSISLSGQVDDVRFYPKDALMKSFTHQTGFGVSSECDPNNRYTFYEYDVLGRLTAVKDHDGNILKAFEYHYREQ